jgi:hypothetical protein
VEINAEWDGPGPRTDAEEVFASTLRTLCSDLDVDFCFHEGADGRIWLMAYIDLVQDGRIRDTLRLDFDERGIRGGRSPAFLDWDDGVRAEDADVDAGPPDGVDVSGDGRSPEQLACIAGEWFAGHHRRWADSARARRRRGE